MGYQHRLLLEFTAGYGFVGIAVALMGRAHPVGIVLASLLFGILYQGGAELAFEQPAITRDMVVVIGGIIILFAGALDGLFRRLVARAAACAQYWRGPEPWISDILVTILDSALRLSIPLLAACLAGLWSERSGVVDIGLEGKMLVAAFAAAAAASRVRFRLDRPCSPASPRRSPSRSIHGFASISQRGNQIVSGVAINMLAAGLTAIVGNAWYGQGGRTPPLKAPQRFGDVVLRPFARSSILALLAVPLTWFVLGKTRFGLRLRAVGENPAAVDTAGISVAGLRYAAVVIAGVLCGLARHLSLGRPVGRLHAQHDGRQGLHRARGADLRQVARLAGARRLLPVRPPRRRRDPAAGHLAARHRRGAGAGDPGAALSHDRHPARRRHRHAPSRPAPPAFLT